MEFRGGDVNNDNMRDHVSRPLRYVWNARQIAIVRLAEVRQAGLDFAAAS